MFTRPQQLQQKGGHEERRSYLGQLKDEFEKTKSLESKKQVLANLANFAYDPINYEHLKHLRIVDLFLNQLSENCEELIEYGAGGLCNICLDPETREYIIKFNGIHLLSELVTHRNEEIALHALTTLIYLITPENQHLFTVPSVVNKVLELENDPNPRLSNLATIFLQDYSATRNAC